MYIRGKSLTGISKMYEFKFIVRIGKIWPFLKLTFPNIYEDLSAFKHKIFNKEKQTPRPLFSK
jgi:hypothetical protein